MADDRPVFAPLQEDRPVRAISRVVHEWPYYGFYHRINTNRVTAFRGPELTGEQWTKLFGHYVNLILCDSILDFLDWYRTQTGRELMLAAAVCRRIALSLHLPACENVPQLSGALIDARVAFEASLNNIADRPPMALSLQGQPVDELMRELGALPEFRGKLFFFLLDEYENLDDYQQQVINTLVKHSGELYTFKIGVKELGWRRRSTLNENEQLVHPADYVRITIADRLAGESFRTFATTICNQRLSRLREEAGAPVLDVADALPGMTAEDEALQLGAAEIAHRIVKDAAKDLSPSDSAAVSALHPLRICVADYWARGRERSIADELRAIAADGGGWSHRYGNYKHAVLFTLRRGKDGIRKHFCGWETFTQLSASNIRYLLELVDRSFVQHIEKGGTLAKPVPCDVQTVAAQEVGRKNLIELEGISIDGAKLTKLLLGLGRVFGVMAADPEGHTAELNEFHVTDDELTPAMKSILDAAVMHLALVRQTGTKPVDQSETKDFDYMIHPIFSAFFVFSHRRKRKMSLTCQDIEGLIQSHRRTIRDILARHHRPDPDPGDLPQQLTLFEKFYHGDA